MNIRSKFPLIIRKNTFVHTYLRNKKVKIWFLLTLRSLFYKAIHICNCLKNEHSRWLPLYREHVQTHLCWSRRLILILIISEIKKMSSWNREWFCYYQKLRSSDHESSGCRYYLLINRSCGFIRCLLICSAFFCLFCTTYTHALSKSTLYSRENRWILVSMYLDNSRNRCVTERHAPWWMYSS